MPTRADLITVDEAMRQFGHNRNWWFDRIREGDLIAYDIPGERATFLERAAVEKFLQPRPRPVKKTDAS